MDRQHTASELLQQGIAAAKAGQKSEARALLMQSIELDSRSEQAWLWLAGVADTPKHVRTCLQNVLALNPDNQQARKGLAWLDDNQPALQAERVDPHPPVSPPSSAPPVAQPVTGPTIHLETTEPQPASPGYQSERFVPSQPQPASQGYQSERFVPSQAKSAQAEYQPRQYSSDPQPESVASGWQQPAPQASSAEISFTDVRTEPPQPRAIAPQRSAEPHVIDSEPDLPCPYCGAPTALSQRHCLKCKRDLEIRTQSDEKRSWILTLFGGYYWLNGILIILAGILILVGSVLIYQQASQAAGTSALSAALVVATLAVLVILYGSGIVYLGRALHQRARWAYYVVSVLTGLSVLGIFANMGLVAIFLGFFQQLLSPTQIEEIRANVASSTICNVILVLFQLAILGAVYREFFGQRQRFMPSFPNVDHAIHYNNGVAYKNQGMWYMAMREWESAVLKASNNVTYLHALGLAYAQLQRFERARHTLDKALSLAPNERQLQESRALIEKMASR